MQILPAIDLFQGYVVRLERGDFAHKTFYSVQPLALAQSYTAAGAEWLHVVNLDGARTGQTKNLAILADLVRTGLKLQVGGGVRHQADVARLLEAGVARVAIGSIAVQKPEKACAWLEQFGPEHLTIALDVRWRDGFWRTASMGWTQDELATLDHLAPHFAAAGARHLLCTDIDRDGTFNGPNFELYARVRKLAPQLRLQVSGGVRDIGDIRTARASGAAGVVLGRALLEGRFSLPQALAC